jgi:hypothetical protein
MNKGWGIPLSGFTAQWRIPAMPPRDYYIGSRIRGILGHALFSQVCSYPGARCQQCAVAPYCDYTRVFKPIDPAALPAYVLHDWQLTGDTLAVTVLLIGAAQQAAEHWIRGLDTQLPTLDWWGRTGMQLQRVTDWRSGNTLFSGGKFTARARLTPVESWPYFCGDVEVHFITPLASKHQGKEPLQAALKTRVQRLRNQFGDGAQFERFSEYWHCQTLSQQTVELILSQKERRVTCHYYTLKLSRINEEGAALLGAGLWLHAGGQTGLGLGRYRLEIK